MSPPPESNASAPAPLIPLKTVASILADPARWRILRELAGGEALMVVELAERIGISADSTSKHLAPLREAGIVETGRNRLYRMRPQFITDKSERLVDFGYCLLRLDTID